MRPQNTFRRLRIALVPPLWARVAPATQGGVEYIVYLLAEGLVKRGHEVTVFTSSDSPTIAKVEALCECNLIEAMERDRAWEYAYYETCNIAEALQESDAFDLIHWGSGAGTFSTVNGTWATRDRIVSPIPTRLQVVPQWIAAAVQLGLPPPCYPSYGASGSCPGGTNTRETHLPSLDTR